MFPWVVAVVGLAVVAVHKRRERHLTTPPFEQPYQKGNARMHCGCVEQNARKWCLKRKVDPSTGKAKREMTKRTRKRIVASLKTSHSIVSVRIFCTKYVHELRLFPSSRGTWPVRCQTTRKKRTGVVHRHLGAVRRTHTPKYEYTVLVMVFISPSIR